MVNIVHKDLKQVFDSDLLVLLYLKPLVGFSYELFVFFVLNESLHYVPHNVLNLLHLGFLPIEGGRNESLILILLK